MSDYDNWKTTEPDDVLPRDEGDCDEGDETVEKIVDLFSALREAVKKPRVTPSNQDTE